METEKLFEEAKTIACAKNLDVINNILDKLEQEPEVFCAECMYVIHRLKQKFDGAVIRTRNTEQKLKLVTHRGERLYLLSWNSTHYEYKRFIAFKKACIDIAAKKDRILQFSLDIKNKITEIQNRPCTQCKSNRNEILNQNKELIEMLIKYATG